MKKTGTTVEGGGRRYSAFRAQSKPGSAHCSVWEHDLAPLSTSERKRKMVAARPPLRRSPEGLEVELVVHAQRSGWGCTASTLMASGWAVTPKKIQSHRNRPQE